MFEVLYEWAEQGGGRYIWSAVAFAKDRANPIPDTDRADYAASGQVALQIDNRDGSLRGVGGMTFSDRLKLLNGAYGTGPRDRWEIALHRDGAVEIRLLDWGGACGCPILCRGRSCGVSVLVDESVAAGRSDDLYRWRGSGRGGCLVGLRWPLVE